MAFFTLHLPVFVAIAYFNDTDPWLAAVLTGAVLALPFLANRSFTSPRSVSVAYGFTAMLMGGLLVHFGQGPVQIEMHFYFFALLAMLALFGNPAVILVAAATVAAHHLLLWLYLPESVFNYDAPLWVVAIHAAFVVLESTATVYIARLFFDNVIGLEKIIQARTAELDRRNSDMRLVLDNVAEGLLTIDAHGVMSSEYSRILKTCFGEPEEHQTLAGLLRRADPSVADRFALGWNQVAEQFLPLELALDQLPRSIAVDDRIIEITYTPIGDSEKLDRVLVRMVDVTAERTRKRLEAEQKETAQMLDHLVLDRAGFLEFFHEADALVTRITSGVDRPIATTKGMIHTLKGNSMIFGMNTVGDICHEMESRMLDEDRPPSQDEVAQLAGRWKRLRESLSSLLGEKSLNLIEIADAQFQELLGAVLHNEGKERVAQLLASLKLEPTQIRLRRVAAQARRLAQRLEKGDVEIEIDDQTLRLDPGRWSGFWSAFIHVVRNAVDHGLEDPDQRSRLGKEPAGRLTLRTFRDHGEFVIQLADNGRGIAWNEVRERARSMGLPYETPSDLRVALFKDGVSTAKEATEFSGRGIGMGAILEACVVRGGRVEVHSRDGEGTCFEFRFPAASMAPKPSEMLRDPRPPEVPRS